MFGFCLRLGRYLLLLCSGELCLDQLAGVCPLGLGALAFDVGKGAGWCALPSTAAPVSVPFHAAGVRFVGGLLGQLVGALVAFNPAVAGATSYFDPDPWLLAAEFGDVFFFAAMAYRCLGPGSSEVILHMAA